LAAVALLPFECGADGGQQHFIVKRLLQKIRSAELHGLDRKRNVRVTRNYDDRKGNPEFAQPLQKVDAADARHANVGDDAAGTGDGASRQEVRRGAVGLDLKFRSFQQERERVTDRFVVVDHMQDNVVRRHARLPPWSRPAG
jgi:hypothetical protein